MSDLTDLVQKLLYNDKFLIQDHENLAYILASLYCNIQRPLPKNVSSEKLLKYYHTLQYDIKTLIDFHDKQLIDLIVEFCPNGDIIGVTNEYFEEYVNYSKCLAEIIAKVNHKIEFLTRKESRYEICRKRGWVYIDTLINIERKKFLPVLSVIVEE